MGRHARGGAWHYAGLLAATAGFANAEYMAEHRGGTLKIIAHSAGGTIDPHINYTLQYWGVYQQIYDGLLKFKQAAGADGFNVVADLAEAIPAPENGGKTFTFKIRKGIKFSDGRELGVKDVVASFQRIFKVSSPTSGTFYAGIVGADKCLKEPKTCTLDAKNDQIVLITTEPVPETGAAPSAATPTPPVSNQPGGERRGGRGSGPALLDILVVGR